MKKTLDSNRLNQVTNLIDSYVEEEKSAGMLAAIYHQGELRYQKVSGYRDIENRLPIEDDTIFRIYSMTKPITSVGLMMLMEKGHFHIDDPASYWIGKLDQLKVYKKSGSHAELDSQITIRQLLTHTAGFSYGFYPDQHPVDKLYESVWKKQKYTQTCSELIDKLLEIPLLSQPGTQWHYSIATDICGYLIELISDMPLLQYFQKYIFSPLNMTDTGFKVPLDDLHRFSKLYGFSEKQPLAVLETDENSPYFSQSEDKVIKFQSGGGGLVSTAADYLNFAKMMLNHGKFQSQQIIGSKTVEWMTSNHLSEKQLPISYNGIVPQTLKSYGFGLGYCINLDPIQAGTLGSLGDYGCGSMADGYCWIDPKEELIGLLLQQFIPSLHHSGRRDFRNAVYQALV